jgi:hypothetical protein
MEKLNWTFPIDRFVLYKTWNHDSSVVYRFTTWTNAIAYPSSFVTPAKSSIIFLKVQESTYAKAYSKLKGAGLEIDRAAEKGISDNVGTMVGQKIAFWKTTGGKSIKTFLRANIDRIEIVVEEIGPYRIFLIVWEPDKGEPRLQGLKEFSLEHFKAQLTLAQWTEALQKPFKAIGRAVLEEMLRVDG